MRHNKVVATLVGVTLMTAMVIGYAMAQDTGPTRPTPMGAGGYGPMPPSRRSSPTTPPAAAGARTPGGRMYGPMAPGAYGPAPSRPGVQPGFQQMSAALELVEQMRDACFDPQTAGIIAIGGLKDDVRRGPKAVVEDLEQQLLKTKSLGLRNAIRMELKEVYKRQGDDEKALKNLHAMLAENDKSIQEHPRRYNRDDDD